MLEICLAQLADVTNGLLRLGTMPPLAGGLEPVRRVVLDAGEVQPGDVLWLIGASRGWALAMAQAGFAQGALAVVVDVPQIEPWAGKAVLQVADSAAALARMLRCLNHGKCETEHFFGGSMATRLAGLRGRRRTTSEEILQAFCPPARGMSA